MAHTAYTVIIDIIFKIDPDEMGDVSHQMAHDMHGTLLKYRNFFYVSLGSNILSEISEKIC